MACSRSGRASWLSRSLWRCRPRPPAPGRTDWQSVPRPNNPERRPAVLARFFIDRPVLAWVISIVIVLASLPPTVQAIGVSVKKRSPDILLVVNLHSDNDPATGRPRYDPLYLTNYATINLQDALARLEGVGDIFTFGGQDYSMRVWLDPNKLASRNLSAGDVIRVLREQNVQVAAGQVGQPPVPKGHDFQYTLSTLGRLVEAQQFADIILKTGADGEVTYLKNVARVKAGAKSQDQS